MGSVTLSFSLFTYLPLSLSFFAVPDYLTCVQTIYKNVHNNGFIYSLLIAHIHIPSRGLEKRSAIIAFSKHTLIHTHTHTNSIVRFKKKRRSVFVLLTPARNQNSTLSSRHGLARSSFLLLLLLFDFLFPCALEPLRVYVFCCFFLCVLFVSLFAAR